MPPEGRDLVHELDELSDFCHREYPRLVRSLTLYVGDRHVAEELAQETLVRVVDAWQRISRLDRPGGWAHRVSINLANSHFRRQGAERRANHRVVAQDVHREEPPDAAEALAVRAAVTGLPRGQRAVISLRYLADLPVDEVAEILGSTPGSVRVTSSRALRTLRERFGVGVPIAGGVADG